MKVTLDTEAIKTISLFQQITGANVKDFAETPDEMYFVVAEGEYGLAVGKDGERIKRAERTFKKPIKIFEYSPDLESFIRNVIPEAENISIQDRQADDTEESGNAGKDIRVRVKQSERGHTIGKGGQRAKVIENFMKRLHGVASFKIV